jgi:hypothetical protein
MLVNTLLKDLNSFAVARICTALEVLLASPSEVLIPAVQDRLHELLGHTSSVGILIAAPVRLSANWFCLRAAHLCAVAQSMLFARYRGLIMKYSGVFQAA